MATPMSTTEDESFSQVEEEIERHILTAAVTVLSYFAPRF